MTPESFERRVNLSECRCQMTRFALVETALVTQLNPHAIQVTHAIRHGSRLGAGYRFGEDRRTGSGRTQGRFVRGRALPRVTEAEAPARAAIRAVLPMSEHWSTRRATPKRPRMVT